MAAYILPVSRWFYQGVPAANGTVTVYQSGTTTPVTIYADGDLTTPITNPVTLDSNGECKFYVGTANALRLYVATENGTLIEDVDPVYPNTNTVGFSGTGEDLNKIVGITNGTAISNKALVTDANNNVGGIATEAPGFASTRIANMQAVQSSMTGGFVNKFRNVSLDIWQRGTSLTVTSGTSAYTADGWIVGAAGANLTVSQTTPFNPTLYAILIAGNTGVTDAFLRHRIESSLCAQLVSRVCTVQFGIFNGTGSNFTPTLTIKHASVQDNWTSPVTDVNAVSLQPCPNNALTTVAFSFRSSDSAALGMEVTLDFGGAIASNTQNVSITAADIRATPSAPLGLTSTPPMVEYRSFSAEIDFCRRYYINSFPPGVAPAQNAGTAGALFFPQVVGASASQAVCTRLKYPTRMRTNPTITLYNPSASNAQIRNVTANADFTATTPIGNEDGFYLSGTTPGGTAVGQACAVHFAATAEL